MGFPDDCSFGIPASSFPRSGASGISRAIHLTQQGAAWKACAGKRFTVTPPGSPAQQWAFGQYGVDDTTSSIPITMDGLAGSWQRAISARSNVVIDVAVCQTDVTNQAGTIVHDIAAKIGQS